MKISSSKNYTQKLTQKQWEQLSFILYKYTKQKEVFDIQYKFLHFAQRSSTRLREIGQNYGRIECARCNRADETQKNWLFSCSSSRNIFINLLCLLAYIDATQFINKTVEDCLLHHLLVYEKEVSASRELFETYFITIRYLKKKQIMERNILENKNLSFSKMI